MMFDSDVDDIYAIMRPQEWCSYIYIYRIYAGSKRKLGK